MNVYLDYAATTPLDPEVLAAMLPYLQEDFGNPSSLHKLGQQARRGVERAREQVAAAISAEPRNILFTSGATEADNHGLRAVAEQHPGCHIVTSELEHSAVLTTARYLERRGHPVTYLRPNTAGEITPIMLRDALRSDTKLVALMLVNNETGVISDLPAFSSIAHEAGALLFCDAVQAFGVMSVDACALAADMLSLSGHKVYGPKGVGVLYVCEGLELPPFILGGEQERGRRAGTLNVPAIVGMGAAAELAQTRLAEDSTRIAGLRDALEAQLLSVQGVHINGAKAPRSAKHSNVTVSGADGEALLLNLDSMGVYVSAGSACAAGTLEPSHVLLAMGMSRAEAGSSLRFSLGRNVTRADIDYAAARFKEAVQRSRQYVA